MKLEGKLQWNYLGPAIENCSVEQLLGDGDPPVKFIFPGHLLSKLPNNNNNNNNNSKKKRRRSRRRRRVAFFFFFKSHRNRWRRPALNSNRRWICGNWRTTAVVVVAPAAAVERVKQASQWKTAIRQSHTHTHARVHTDTLGEQCSKAAQVRNCCSSWFPQFRRRLLLATPFQWKLPALDSSRYSIVS